MKLFYSTREFLPFLKRVSKYNLEQIAFQSR